MSDLALLKVALFLRLVVVLSYHQLFEVLELPLPENSRLSKVNQNLTLTESDSDLLLFDVFTMVLESSLESF